MRGRQRQRGAQAPLAAQPFDAVIDRLSHDGRGIARWRDKTLFVSGALPGETVTVKQTGGHSKFNEAKTLDIISRSPERVEPVCEYYDRCGGCDLQHLAIEAQVAAKEKAVLDQLSRWGGLRPSTVLPPLRSKSEGYRARARLAVQWTKAGEPLFGFREAGSKQVVAISSCAILDPRLEKLIAPLNDWLNAIARNRPVTHIELTADDHSASAVIRHNRPLLENDLAILSQLSKTHAFNVFRQLESGGSLLDLNGHECDPRLNYQLPAMSEPDDDLTIAFHPLDFIQVNPDLNRQMVAQAMSLLDINTGDKVADLFCGVGNFTLPMAARASEVIGIEAQESMVVRGRENAKAQGLDSVRFVAADLEKPMASALLGQGDIDAMLLDPPRSGAAGAMPLIAQLSPAKLVYISCNPSTLARDAKSLAEQGYQLEVLGIMDMFPHTSHVESMALFVRNQGNT